MRVLGNIAAFPVFVAATMANDIPQLVVNAISGKLSWLEMAAAAHLLFIWVRSEEANPVPTRHLRQHVNVSNVMAAVLRVLALDNALVTDYLNAKDPAPK
jgi:hypothetical protein